MPSSTSKPVWIAEIFASRNYSYPNRLIVSTLGNTTFSIAGDKVLVTPSSNGANEDVCVDIVRKDEPALVEHN